MGEVVDLTLRPTYSMAQVDRLLGVPGGTARRWIDGYTRAGRRYPPVVRPESTGDEIVTWGEFVETRLLAHYRKKGVPLLRIRPVIEQLRVEYGVPYPLALAELWFQGRELVQELEESVQIAPGLRLAVVTCTGQLTWSVEAQAFVDEAEWDDPNGPVTRIRPLGRGNPVVIDPERQFGEPVVRSVRTEIVAEHFRVGERPESIAELFDLSLDEVNAALRFEMWQLQAA